MSHRIEQCPELPAPPGRILSFAVLALSAGIAAAWWIDRPRGPECAGFLKSRDTVVKSEVDGTVESVAAVEGKPIRLGEPLLTLRNEALDRQIAAQRRTVAAMESELARAQAKADLELKWRMRTLESEICDIQLRSAGYLKEKYDFEMQRTMLSDLLNGSHLATVDEASTAFKTVVLENRQPRPERLTTVLQLEAASNAADVSAAQVEICETQQKSLERLKQELPEQIRQMEGVHVAEANLAHAREVFTQLEAQQAELTIVSPAIGKVGSIKIRPGDHIRKGDAVADLLDDAQRYLVVHVPSRQITKFGSGQKLALSFPGGISRTGVVKSVAPQASAESAASTDPVVLVHVEATGALWPDVPVGSQVNVHPAQ